MEGTIGFLIGLIVGEVIIYMVHVYRNPKNKLRYCIDITLKYPCESYKQFIKRAHKERLGEYVVID